MGRCNCRSALAAAKLVALLARHTGRDLYDAVELLRRDDWDWGRLRFAFLAYGAWNRRDWRTVSVDDIRFEKQEILSNLIPVLKRSAAPTTSELLEWGRGLVEECKDQMSALLPLPQEHVEFLTQLNDHGVIKPDLVTTEPDMCRILTEHPMTRWKAANVLQFRRGE